MWTKTVKKMVYYITVCCQHYLRLSCCTTGLFLVSIYKHELDELELLDHM